MVAGLLVVALAACTDPAPSSAPTDSPATSTPSTTSAAEPPPNTLITGHVPFPMDATIAELQRAMRNGRITSVELVDFFPARIEAYDDAGPGLSALITINPRARAEAAALDAERAASGPRGPLHGIPLVVKDTIDTAEMPTTAGTPVHLGGGDLRRRLAWSASSGSVEFVATCERPLTADVVAFRRDRRRSTL